MPKLYTLRDIGGLSGNNLTHRDQRITWRTWLISINLYPLCFHFLLGYFRLIRVDPLRPHQSNVFTTVFIVWLTYVLRI